MSYRYLTPSRLSVGDPRKSTAAAHEPDSRITQQRQREETIDDEGIVAEVGRAHAGMRGVKNPSTVIDVRWKQQFFNNI